MTDLRKDYPEIPAQPPAQVATWLNRDWEYLPASSHGDSQAFAERQRQRLAEAQKQRTAA